MTLREQLIRDEGMVLHAYQDFLGYWTIGVGRLIDERKGGGITREEAEYLLDNDIGRARDALRRALPWTETLDDARQGVLLNMCFNLGINGLLGFTKMLAALDGRDYRQAAHEMLGSRWARQVGDRARRLAEHMRDGRQE